MAIGGIHPLSKPILDGDGVREGGQNGYRIIVEALGKLFRFLSSNDLVFLMCQC